MIRKTRVEDGEKIFELYRRVASIPGGLARYQDEVTREYVNDFVKSSVEDGLSLAAEIEGKIVGELHAYRPFHRVFRHVLGDLTIGVDPACQGKGIGRNLFTEFMRIVVEEMKDIERVELIARESNVRALKFYEGMGFVVEGQLRNKIRGVDGSLEKDIIMGWIREDIEINLK